MVGESYLRPHAVPVEARSDDYLSDRDEEFGELFRSFLPEDIAGMPYDFIVDLAVNGQGSEIHGRMVDAARLYLQVVRRNVQEEIQDLKKGSK